MPVLARSDPIELNMETLPVAPPEAPLAAPPTAPVQLGISNNILERHRQFIGKIDAAPTCFTKEALPGFSDDEFSLHLGIAQIDKYVTDAGNEMYCSKAAVEKLSQSLERLKV